MAYHSLAAAIRLAARPAFPLGAEQLAGGFGSRERGSQRADYSSASRERHATTTVPCGVSLCCTVGPRGACHVARRASWEPGCVRARLFYGLGAEAGVRAICCSSRQICHDGKSMTVA